MTLFARPYVATREDVVPAVIAGTAGHVNPVVRATLVLFVLSIPFEIPHRGAFPIEVPTLTGLLFLAATLLNPSACYRRIPSSLVWIAVWLWILAIASLVNNTQQIVLAFRMFISLTLLMLLCWTAFNALADRRVLHDVLGAVVIGGVLRSAAQVARIGTTAVTVWTGGDRVTVFGQNANLSAMILSAALVTIVGLRELKGRGLPELRAFTWPLAGLVALAILQTGSRGGLLCAGIGMASYWFRGRTPLQQLRNGVLGILAAVLLGVGAMNTEVMRNRLEETATEGKMAGRERIYPAALEMFRERPLLGWGPIDNQYEIAKRIQDPIHASRDVHNLVLELLTTTGVIGAVPFLIGLGLCIRSAWRARSGTLGILPFGVLTAVLTGCVSGTWIEGKILWFAITLALAAGAHWAEAPDRPVGSVA